MKTDDSKIKYLINTFEFKLMTLSLYIQTKQNQTLGNISNKLKTT